MRASSGISVISRRQHRLGARLSLFWLRKVTERATSSIREAAGPSIKSAVAHSYVRDTRDDALLGTRGSYVKLSHEFAGLGGDAQFYKAEGAGQLARRLLPGVVSPILNT